MENSGRPKIMKTNSVSQRSQLIFSLAQNFHQRQDVVCTGLEKSVPTESDNVNPDVACVKIYEITPDGTLMQCSSINSNTKGLDNEVEIAVASTVGQEDSDQEKIGNEIISKKIRKRKSDISNWNMNENKQKRMDGEEYKGLKKNDGKWSYDQSRRARQIKPFCNCKHSKNDSKIKCNIFTEEERLNMFKRFWDNLNWGQRRTYINSLIDTAPPKDKKNMKSAVSRRNITLFYHLKKNGIRVRVCKKMFTNTLDIGEWSARNWAFVGKAEEDPENKIVNTVDLAQPKTIKRKSIRFAERKNVLNQFFNMLPKLESHYCRASSQRLYLEPVWQSKLSLYNEYLKFCQDKESDHLSTKVFYEEFDENKLSLFRPRKDQCDLWVSHKAGNITEDEFMKHIEKKNRAREEKEHDKKDAVHIFTVDMQSVLLCPMLKASSIYYKKKLVVHNYTIYNLKNNEGFCFLWHEGEGGITSNEFSTILYDFIGNKSGVKSGEEVIIFSDGCGYQNRNVTLTNALLHLSKKKKITIIQKYLVPGHTQMECDSMHSTIERKVRNQEIYTPAGYISACKSARKHPRPYAVEYLRHTYFKNFSTLAFFTSIRPGIKVGDATVNNLCALKYTEEGTLFFKTNYDDAWTQLSKRNQKKVHGTEEIPNLHDCPLPIKKSKFEHLQDLKKEIPHDYHLFYDTLKYY